MFNKKNLMRPLSGLSPEASSDFRSLEIQKFLELNQYIIPVPATVYSLENVEIKDETCRENFV